MQLIEGQMCQFFYIKKRLDKINYKESARVRGSNQDEEMCFSRFLKMDSAARIELGRSFHQMGTVNEKSVKVILCLFGMVQ